MYCIKTKQSLTKSYLSVSKLKLPEVCKIMQVQADKFSEELKSLKDNMELNSRSKLRCSHYFLKDGLISVGGRLENRNYGIIPLSCR